MLLRAIAGVLGLGLCANALVMLFDPALWYGFLPGVSSTGPLNAHFARDLGCANLVSGVALLVHALGQRAPTSALFAAAGFLVLHAGVHAWELVGASHGAGHTVLRDLPTVYTPAALAAWIAAAAAHADARCAALPSGRPRTS